MTRTISWAFFKSLHVSTHIVDEAPKKSCNAAASVLDKHEGAPSDDKANHTFETQRMRQEEGTPGHQVTLEGLRNQGRSYGMTGKVPALQNELSFLLNPEDEGTLSFFIPEHRMGMALQVVMERK